MISKELQHVFEALPQSEMLTTEQVEELLDSKERLVEFITSAIVQTISIGLQRVAQPNITVHQLSAFGDFLRKIRADLVGVGEDRALPTMMVNIALSSQQPSTTIPVSASPQHSAIDVTPDSVQTEAFEIAKMFSMH